MKNNKNITVADIEALLPQTQCELCTYKGCKPYAEAILNSDERIDLCLPGGVDVLKKLGNVCGIETASLESEMRKKAKPPMTAVIREDECIGCTKCIQACPVEAIIGASKLMHTVLTDACNGCELCIAPCPVDCIDLIVLTEKSSQEKDALAKQSLTRYQAKKARQANTLNSHDSDNTFDASALTITERQSEIRAIMNRINHHLTKQLKTP